MSSRVVERRLVIECAWCRKKQLIPTEWAGLVIECIHCGKKGRAYGYLSAPDHLSPKEHDLGYMLTDDDNDCRGGLIASVIYLLGFWTVIISILVWLW